MQNHVIDPTFFYDAIEEFSFDYNIYVVINKSIDDDGYEVEEYSKQTIRGSFQSTGILLKQSKDGNIKSKGYNFYCKSLYRLNIGDIIEYKNDFYRVNEIMDDYDEWGVRAAKLTMIKLANYTALANYIKYLEGELLV